MKNYDREEIWESYYSKRKEIDRAKKVVELIPEDVSSVLDIGCGNGIVTNLIKKPLVVGADFARTPLKNVSNNPIQSSIDSLPIKEKTFDLIVLTEVLEHLEDEIYFKALKEIKRIKSNYIIISVPFDQNLQAGYAKCSVCGNVFNIAHHYRKFSNDFFKTDFAEYKLMKACYLNYALPHAKMVTTFGHKLNIYAYSRKAMCNKCGNPATRSSGRYFIRGLDLIFSIIVFIFKMKKKPVHQIVLLKRIIKS